MTTTAVAHPIQGLVKYHGLADFETREPLHGSISACVQPLETRTTVEAGHEGDRIEIDGVEPTGRSRERAVTVLDAVREQADTDTGFRVASASSFPQGVGLGSSSSGFAALALAAARELGLDAPLADVARMARLGAGSATRATVGGVADWRLEEGASSTARPLARPDELDWPIVVALVDHTSYTESVHREVMASPLLDARRDHVEDALAEMREAVRERDRRRILQLAERDTLNLHAVTMTGEAGRLTWQPPTVAVMHEVWALRDEHDVPAWFSIDTGATVYVNTLPGHQDTVAERLARIDGVRDVLRGSLGGRARVVDEHLL